MEDLSSDFTKNNPQIGTYHIGLRDFSSELAKTTEDTITYPMLLEGIL